MEKETNTKNILTIGGIALAVVALIAAFYFSFTYFPSLGGFVATTTATSTAQFPGGNVSASGDVVIDETPTNPAPDYMKPITFASSIEQNVRVALNANLTEIQATLKKNPGDLSTWLRLGNIYHLGGDERAAEKIWLYTAAAAPNVGASFDNLGELYLNYIKDPAKAEANFKKAVAIDSHDVNAYRNLFSLYTDYGYKTANAEPILKEAIQSNPSMVDLQIILARFYKAKGRTAEAKAEYDVAIATARAAGNTQLVSDIETEKASF